jgi:hypothetical protein
MPSKNYIKVYASPADLDSIHAIAARLRLPVSRLARDAVLGHPIPTPPPAIPAVNRSIYADLGTIGNNLNQIAKRLNSGADPDAATLQASMVKLAQALKAIRADLLTGGHA